MSPLVRRAAALAALLVAAACAERPTPLEPRSDHPPASAPLAASGAPEQAIHERLTRRFAQALRDADFRSSVYQALQRSRVREGKVYLQQFLAADNGKHRKRLAELAEEADAAVAGDLSTAAPIEIYLPVPEQRKAWKGDAKVLVATAEGDRDAPVAYDTKGKRQLLDPDRPPNTPVIALGRAEVGFAPAGPAGIDCSDCWDDGSGGTGGDPGIPYGGGGGSYGGAALNSPGLYLTYAKFGSKFEGWLKGAPEFEVHVMGREGTSNAMRSYQCAGETAVPPYEFNQDEKEWSGNVMLFSQTQLDIYNAANPGHALRILVLEDDDTPCVIKTDSSRVTKMIQAIANSYGIYSGGKDTPIFSVKQFKNAPTLLGIFRSFWSFFQSQDEIVGFALEDAVAGEYVPGANWIVKGENTVTNGALRLVMR